MIDRRMFLAFAAGTVLTGCTAQVPEKPRLSLQFTHLSRLRLAVAGLRVESRYVAPMAAPNVDHAFPVPPHTALRTWSAQRLKAIGGTTDQALLVIEEASALQERLRTDKGVTGLFKDEQADRYRTRVAATLTIRTQSGATQATARATASRSVTTPEGTTLNERDRVWFDLTAALMEDFDDQMERQIRRHMAAWLR